MAAPGALDVTLTIHGAVTRGTFTLSLELDLRDGEVTAVVGPNGSGKSTLLRLVAGLLALSTGSIHGAGQVWDDASTEVFVPADRRRVGVVFQDHRLFPHLKALDNVAFGPRRAGRSKAAARAEAQVWLDRLGVGALAGRRPAQLSGGQAQRVALARALATEPDVLLLDEPLSALDVETRADVQAELAGHLASFAGPTVIVTHDPIEALLLAGRIVVLDAGRIVQDAGPAEVAGRPANPYVARLVGVNLFAGTADGGTVMLDGGGRIVSATDNLTGPALVALRPSSVTLHLTPPSGSARNVWPGTVRALAQLADRVRVTVEAEPTTLVDVTMPAVVDLGLAPGRAVWLSAKATDLVAYPAPPR